MKKLFILVLMSIGLNVLSAQVAIGTDIIEPNIALTFASDPRTIILPRVTSVDNISLPVEGMLVYDTGASCIRGYANGAWNNCFTPPTTPQAWDGTEKGIVIGDDSVSYPSAVLAVNTPDMAIRLPRAPFVELQFTTTYPGMMVYDTFSDSIKLCVGGSWVELKD